LNKRRHAPYQPAGWQVQTVGGNAESQDTTMIEIEKNRIEIPPLK